MVFTEFLGTVIFGVAIDTFDMQGLRFSKIISTLLNVYTPLNRSAYLAGKVILETTQRSSENV